MKKWLALLCAISILFSSTAAFAATVSVSSDTTVTGGGSGVTSMAALGSTLYLLYEDGRVTAMDPATRAETELGYVLNSSGYMTAADLTGGMENAAENLLPMDTLFVDGTTLYGLCVPTGELFTVLDSANAFAPAKTGVTLSTQALFNEDRTDHVTTLSRCALDGTLYYVLRSDAAGNASTSVLLLNLTTGEATVAGVQNLQELTPYKDGLLMARRYDMNNITAAAQSGKLPPTEYGTYDPKTDAFTLLGEIKSDGTFGGYAVSGFSYSAENDTLYYTNGSHVEGLTIATGETRISAYTGGGMLGDLGSVSQTLFVPGGTYAKANSSDLTLYQLDTDAVRNGALRVFGEFGSEAHKSFSKNYPDIPVDVVADLQFDIETLANAMVSENEAYDVLLLMMSYMPVEKLIAKGYCADLSGNAEIMKRVSDMDPRFLDGVTVDGKLYGVPVSSAAFTFGVNLELWQSLGLTESDLPTTVAELYDFLANYAADYADDHPDLRLFDMGTDNLKMMLFSLLLDNYVAYCQTELQGQLTFDNPLFRDALNAMDQIDFDELKNSVTTDQTSYAQSDSLFVLTMPVCSFSSYYDAYTPMPLALSAEVQPIIGANLSVLIINPKTKRMDDAVKYVCNYLDHLDDSSAVVFYPGDNEPRISSIYKKYESQIQESLKKQNDLLATADESQKAAIQDQIQQLNDQLASMDNIKYNVTAKQIDTFRNQVSGLLRVSQQSVLYSGDKNTQAELNKVAMQYLSGTMTQEQFVQEMDKRARMMQLEDQ